MESINHLEQIKEMMAHTYICFVDTENFSAKHFMKVRRKLWELEEAHKKGKFTIVFGKKNASRRLKFACNMYKPLDE